MVARAGWLAVCALAAALPAAAQDRPQYFPTRDVAVEYRIEGGNRNGGPQTIKIFYAAHGEWMRIDAGRRAYSIIDRAKGRMIIVMASQKSYMEMPFNPDRQRDFLLSDKVKFTRLGNDTVAGLACTIWQFELDKRSGTACITADGVMLRGEAPAEASYAGKIVAVSVTYGPQPGAMFVPPAGYNRLEMPRLPPGLAPGGLPLPH